MKMTNNDMAPALKEPEHLYLNREDVPAELMKIMQTWYSLSKEVGDKGSCVIGAGFQFIYKNTLYFMSACSPWQGSISWETYKDTIQTILELIGATEIRYNWGVMD